MNRRLALAAAGRRAAAGGLRRAATAVTSDVSSFGDWPAERKPGSYAFERLPSQQAQAAEHRRAGGRRPGALLKAGFTPAADRRRSPTCWCRWARATALIGVQLWDDPLWWRGGFGYWRHGPWMGPYWGWSGWYRVAALRTRGGAADPRPRQRQAAVRDPRQQRRQYRRRRRVRWRAMFEAALMDFPRLGLNPRRVVVSCPSRPRQPLPAFQAGAAASARRSSSQPLSVSRALRRCSGVVALWICAAKRAVVVGQPLLVGAVVGVGRALGAHRQRAQARPGAGRGRRARPPVRAASPACRAGGAARSASQRFGVEGRGRHAGGDDARAAARPAGRTSARRAPPCA